MKKYGILNAPIAEVLAAMGHTDSLAIADCGLPIPNDVRRIDLAVKKGLPSFLEVLSAISDDMVIEKIVLAAEIQEKNPAVFNAILQMLHGIPIEFVQHTEFKALTKSCKAIVRTGEATPYANIILYSGVNF